MTGDQILFVISASICLAAAIFAITRRDARSSAIGLLVALTSIGALFAGLGAVLLALIQVIVYATCATIPLFAALRRVPGLRGEARRAGRPALPLAAALVGIACSSLLGVAILRTVLPPAPLDGHTVPTMTAMDAAALELFGRLGLASAALFMIVGAALVTAVAARDAARDAGAE